MSPASRRSESKSSHLQSQATHSSPPPPGPNNNNNNLTGLVASTSSSSSPSPPPPPPQQPSSPSPPSRSSSSSSSNRYPEHLKNTSQPKHQHHQNRRKYHNQKHNNNSANHQSYHHNGQSNSLHPRNSSVNHLNANNTSLHRGSGGYGSSSSSGSGGSHVNSNSGRHPQQQNSNNQAQVDLGSVNPYWPEFHQGHGDPPPLHDISPTNQTAPPPARPPRSNSTRSTTTTKSQTMNQNQVHAQTHPWRIKVYNACLACRKKKIKCDGLPTCKRCERMGFECSYIEVPQTPQSKAKQTTSEPSQSTSFTQDRQGGGGGHQGTETSKELRQQRRSSTKDAASGSFSHTAMRRKDLPKDTSDFSPMDTSSGVQFPGKDQMRLSEATRSRPMSAFVMERDTIMPDLYHILVNSVTIPNVSKFTKNFSSGLMGVDHFNITSHAPAFTVMNQDHTDSDQQQSFFQKDPTSISDQATPLGFVITNKSVIQYLVRVYFECFHGHWMIVDKDKFLAQLKDPSTPPDPLLLVAICAAGAKYSDHEGLCAEPGNLSTIGEQFLTHARILLQDRFDVPSMPTLQALLILYWCQVQTGRASLRFMYVGMAIRMAQEMGLNRPVDPKRLKEMDNREVQIRKTIWWSCYQADRWTSAALGKPMVSFSSCALTDAS